LGGVAVADDLYGMLFGDTEDAKQASKAMSDLLKYKKGMALIGAQAGGPMGTAAMMEKQAAGEEKTQLTGLDKRMQYGQEAQQWKDALAQRAEQNRYQMAALDANAGLQRADITGQYGLIRSREALVAKEAGASGALASVSDATIDNWATTLRKRGTMPQLPRGKEILPIRDMIVQRALEQDPDFDQATAAATYSGKATAYAKLKTQQTNIGAFKDTALRNIDVLKGFIGKIPNLGSPILNKPARAAARAMGNTDVAAFESALMFVQQETARILATAQGNGIVTDDARRHLESAMSSADTPEQAIAVLDKVILPDFANRSKAHDAALSALEKDIGGESSKASAAPVKKYNPKTDSFE
jgi:hypothetical protein